VTEGLVCQLRKIKRPGGLYRFELEPAGQDADGCWLRGRVGAPWQAPHDRGGLSMPVVLLLAPGRPWVAWWVAEPGDPRLEIDICLPPEQVPDGWRYVDLELDPVRHETDGRVEIEDWDEYAESLAAGWMSAADGELARATAEDLAQRLRTGTGDWQRRGWELLGR
jgi:hypothetical protein